MQHIYALKEHHLAKLKTLFVHKFEGEFFELSRANGFSEIAQWSDKYQNVKILSVPTDRLNFNDCID